MKLLQVLLERLACGMEQRLEDQLNLLHQPAHCGGYVIVLLLLQMRCVMVGGLA